jgi:CubicO group peptidase (beta-lactamase class C family)
MSGSPRFINVALAIGVLCGFSASRSIDALRQSETKARPTRGPDRKLSDEQIVRDLRSSLNELVARDRFSGAVLPAKNDQVLFEQAYGFANHAFNVPNKVDTKFNLGSMGKMFTAVAILQLAQQGRLSLNELYAAPQQLEARGAIAAKWGTSHNDRCLGSSRDRASG